MSGGRQGKEGDRGGGRQGRFGQGTATGPGGRGGLCEQRFTSRGCEQASVASKQLEAAQRAKKAAAKGAEAADKAAAAAAKASKAKGAAVIKARAGVEMWPEAAEIAAKMCPHWEEGRGLSIPRTCGRP